MFNRIELGKFGVFLELESVLQMLHPANASYRPSLFIWSQFYAKLLTLTRRYAGILGQFQDWVVESIRTAKTPYDEKCVFVLIC